MKQTIPNETIYFENKKIPPGRDGKYRCPFHCGRSGYPPPSWKTMAGFLKHLNECPKSEAGRKKQDEANKILWEAEQRRREEILATVPQKIGETIHFVEEIITKPTHVRRGDRMVHVRYEPEMAFRAETIVINHIEWDQSRGVIFNRRYSPRTICASAEEARQEAKKHEVDWKECVEMCQRCR